MSLSYGCDVPGRTYLHCFANTEKVDDFLPDGLPVFAVWCRNSFPWNATAGVPYGTQYFTISCKHEGRKCPSKIMSLSYGCGVPGRSYLHCFANTEKVDDFLPDGLPVFAVWCRNSFPWNDTAGVPYGTQYFTISCKHEGRW